MKVIWQVANNLAVCFLSQHGNETFALLLANQNSTQGFFLVGLAGIFKSRQIVLIIHTSYCRVISGGQVDCIIRVRLILSEIIVYSFIGDCGGGNDYNCILGSLFAECFRASSASDLPSFHPAAPS